jgi:hypothetical protein
MTRRSIGFALAIFVLGAPFTAPAAASGTPLDVASTHAYILANFALARASEAKVAIGQARVLGLDRSLARACPDVGAGSPENEEAQKLTYEVAGALWSVTYGVDAGPIDAFARAVRPLRWSDARITRRAQNYAHSLQGLATIKAPDLCADVRAWSTSGFHTIPASTLVFDQHVESIEAHTIPAQMLAPYEHSADRSVLVRTERLETRLEHIETVTGYNDWESTLETLGLNL